MFLNCLGIPVRQDVPGKQNFGTGRGETANYSQVVQTGPTRTWLQLPQQPPFRRVRWGRGGEELGGVCFTSEVTGKFQNEVLSEEGKCEVEGIATLYPICLRFLEILSRSFLSACLPRSCHLLLLYLSLEKVSFFNDLQHFC